MKTQKTVFERHSRLTTFIICLLIFCLLDLSVCLWYLKTKDFRSFRTKDPYFHHGLLPNQKARHKWGNTTYPIYTNSLGFKDGRKRKIDLSVDNKRIVFMGDSFTEGVGYHYDHTFVGKLEKKFEKDNVDILNAGVESYSPKLYYLKTKYLIEKVNLDFDHLAVLLDLSDIQDEISYEGYESLFDQEQSALNEFFWRQVYRLNNFLKRYSMLYKGQYNLLVKKYKNQDRINAQSYVWENIGSYYQERDMWTYNEHVYISWGEKGIEIAQESMNKLVDLCAQHDIQLTLVIYPWPRQITKNDRQGRQEELWEGFAQEFDVDLINLYPLFMDQPDAQKTVEQYFVKGDFHWNKKGHAFVAENLYNKLKD